MKVLRFVVQRCSKSITIQEIVEDDDYMSTKYTVKRHVFSDCELQIWYYRGSETVAVTHFNIGNISFSSSGMEMYNAMLDNRPEAIRDALIEISKSKAPGGRYECIFDEGKTCCHYGCSGEL
jgi:hypothetical protein